MSQNALRILCEKTFIRHRQRDSIYTVSSSRHEIKRKRETYYSLPLKYVMKANLLAYATTYSQFRLECIRAIRDQGCQ